MKLYCILFKLIVIFSPICHFNNSFVFLIGLTSSIHYRGNASFLYEDETLGYWPGFRSLSSKCRGAYVDWLASNRDNPETPIGYVFIYFYGLERRILVDHRKNSLYSNEYVEVFKEVKRLWGIFGENRSFNSYSLKFLKFMYILNPELIDSENIEFINKNGYISFKYHLAKIVESGDHITADMALKWFFHYWNNSDHYYPRTPVRRCKKEFSRLFKHHYTEKYKKGFKIKPVQKKLIIYYNSASNSLNRVTIKNHGLSDPSTLKSAVKILVDIAEACTDELTPYSKYLGRQNSSPEDIAELLLVPDVMVSKKLMKLIGEFQVWADLKIKEKGGLVAVLEIWPFTGTPMPAKINKKELDFILSFIKKAGYGIAPDPAYHSEKFSIDGFVVIFKGGHGDLFEPSSAFKEVAMLLRLGAMVAYSDFELHNAELSTLRKLVDNHRELSPVEKESLNAYLTWRLNTPSNMVGLKAKFAKLDENQKRIISSFLIRIALADGKIVSEELKVLEKVYRAIGLDKSLVTSDIHDISTGKASDSTNVSKGDSNSFELNQDVLSQQEFDTEEVQTMLREIFLDDEEDLKDEEPPEQEEVSIAGDGLDEQHRILYQTLIKKDQWAREEVEKLCRQLKLMVDGAIEIINDWSYDRVEALVLEDYGNICIEKEIVKELEG